MEIRRTPPASPARRFRALLWAGIVGILALFIAGAPALDCAPAEQPAPRSSRTDGVRPFAPNPRYLTDANGHPTFAIGCYRFLPDTVSEWLPILDYATANGLNTVRALAIADGWIKGGGAPAAPMPYARDGGGALAADGGQRLNLARFDPRFWDNFDAFLTAAEARGLLVVCELFGVSGPFGGGDRRCTPEPPHYGCFVNNFWHMGNSISGPPGRGNDWRTQTAARKDFFHPQGSMRAVQESILARHLDITTRHRNVIYQPVNEMFAYEGLNSGGARRWMGWVRDQIRIRDPDAVVLVNTTIHPRYGIDAGGYDGVTIHAPYENNGPLPGRYDLDQMVTDLTSLSKRKRFVGYDCDVGEPYAATDYQDYQRKAAWVTLTGGGGMYLILENVFAPPWTDRPLAEPGHYLKFLPQFLRARSVEPWHMAPRRDLLTGGAAAATTTVLARPREMILAYLRAGGEIHLDRRGLPPVPSAEWFDPRTGVFSRAEATLVDSRSCSFAAPAGEDWVLLIRPYPA